MNKTTPTPVAGLEAFTAEEIRAELRRRGITATPPAGFRREIFMQCGEDGYDPCEPYGECEHEQDICCMGPDVGAETFGGISSQWSPEDGIFFLIQKHDGPTWTREQLTELPEMVKQALSQIDLAEAKAFFKANPAPFEGTPTIDDLYQFAQDNNLKAPQTFEAYVAHTNGGTK